MKIVKMEDEDDNGDVKVEDGDDNGDVKAEDDDGNGDLKEEEADNCVPAMLSPDSLPLPRPANSSKPLSLELYTPVKYLQ